MGNKEDRLDGQLPLPFEDDQPPTAAMNAWWSELGEAAESLGRMMRKPTDARPFVYEVRFDLMSLGNSVGLIMCKGFGADGGLIAFHDCAGFIDGIKGLEARMRAGKLKWQPDQYPPGKYEQRTALYLSGDVYRLG